MRSGYREIGEFVQQVNIRNTGLAVTNLQGISINKYFMPSVANINGTDLAKYKVVKQKQFAFNPMHVGRDEVLPIAMLDNDDSVIVSPAYVVFEVIDKKALLPEYLMMWCSRPEFDRNAWFTTDSSVRGGFSWDDFCALTLPVPSLEKQQKIVKEYQVIVDRIKLNERISQKLEETAQAIYKHWFVDFEFPMSAEYAASIGKPELEGQPYKSSGGEMVFNEVLEMEIPKGWDVASIDTVFSMRYGKNLPTNQLSETGYDVFGGNGLIGRYAEYMYEDKQVALACRGAASGKVNITTRKSFVTNNSIVVENYKPAMFPYLKYYCLHYHFEDHVTGSAQPQLTIDSLSDVFFINPLQGCIYAFSRVLKPLEESIDLYLQEIRFMMTVSKMHLTSLTSKDSL
jgi:type I restriction enzyme, S subunit